MPSLHLISHSIDAQALARNADRYLKKGDSILLIADGVLLALQQPLAQSLKSLSENCYLLDQDCLCRGLNQLLNQQVDDFRIEQISYEGMVELCARSKQVISW